LSWWIAFKTLTFIFLKFYLVDCLSGDFVVGNRPLFYELLLPNVRKSARIPNSGHLVMYDQPVILANHIAQFIADN
jgi:pimeloyl-ACP methyl ester carboxylesterase